MKKVFASVVTMLVLIAMSSCSSTDPVSPAPEPEATSIAAPTGLFGAFDSRNSRVNLSWVDNAGGRYQYLIEHNESQHWVEIGHSDPGAERFSTQVVQEDANATSHEYRVRAVNDAISPTLYSEYSSTSTVAVPKRPAAPSDLATAISSRFVQCGSGSISLCLKKVLVLSWTNAAENTAEIRIRRSILRPGIQFALLETLPALTGDRTSWSDNTISDSYPDDGTKYTYQVQVFTPDGYSKWSDPTTYEF